MEHVSLQTACNHGRRPGLSQPHARGTCASARHGAALEYGPPECRSQPLIMAMPCICERLAGRQG
eukprot:15449206-Alexandrium_andersonii.AAC.1